MATSTLEVVIKGRDQLSPTLNRVERNLDKLRDSVLTGVGLGAGIGGFALLSEGIAKTVDAMGAAVQAASALSEQQNRVAVVFGASTSAVTRFAETSAASFAISERAALEAAGGLGNMFTAMGIGQQKAAEMSVEMVKLAGDLASFNNIPVEIALEKLRAGLAGEIEPLRTLGVNLSDVALRQQALAMGLTVTSAPLDAQTKTMAAYELILKQTATAQGDFERTSDSLANKQRALAAQVENLSAKIGGVLIPFATNAVTMFDNFAWALDRVSDAAPDAAGGVDVLGRTLGIVSFGLTDGLARLNDYIAAWRAEEDAVDSGARAHERSITATRKAAQTWAGSLPAMNSYNLALLVQAHYANSAAERVDMLKKVQEGAAYSATVAATGAWTATTAFYAMNAGLERAGMGVSATDERVKKLTTSLAGASDKSSAAFQRMIDYIKRLDDASRTTFERMISNLDRVIQRQLDSIDAARRAREEARQQEQDRRDLAAAEKALRQATQGGNADAVRDAAQSLADVRARIEEAQTRKHEDELRRQWEATRDYINAVAQLESNAKNRKALANTLAARQTALEGQRAAAMAAGNSDLVAMIDAKLAAINAAITRNDEARRNAEATAKVQQMLTVHTVINLDGKTIAEVVDKYLGRN